MAAAFPHQLSGQGLVMHIFVSFDAGWAFMFTGWLPDSKAVDMNIHPTEAV